MLRGAFLLLFLFDWALRADGLGSLKPIAVPEVPNLDRYVRDRRALLVLGKALFWDMQVGSDSRTACATCHFHAGADHRAKNQLSDPLNPFPPNRQQIPSDFPIASGRRVGSAGVVRRILSKVTPAGDEVASDDPSEDGFHLGDLHIRQVTSRNAPTVINAVLNVRNFLDGRASDIFNGRTPFGESDPRPNVIAVVDGRLQPEMVRLANSSLASQAVSPPLNTVEMSYQGRTWPVLARKLLTTRPLASQKVAGDDSVLGPFANPSGTGLDTAYTYRSLIKDTFQPAYWDSPESVGGLAAVEFNFPLFFGLAIQAYESTLVANDSRFDQYGDGNRSALTLEEVAGFQTLQTGAFCQFCHAGREMTRASFTGVAESGRIGSILTGVPGNLQVLPSDTGFFRTGVRPIADDHGLNGVDDFGVSFSLAIRAAAGTPAIDGAFKVPGLRNVEFTGPYFHNGGQATLEQVIDFYTRGGNMPGMQPLPAEIIPFSLNDLQRASLVAFLKSLSDDRVRFERAPFDHPEICVPIGYPDTPAPDPRIPTSALDSWADIPAVGRAGNVAPLQTFEELLLGTGRDGSRAHTLTEACPSR